MVNATDAQYKVTCKYASDGLCEDGEPDTVDSNLHAKSWRAIALAAFARATHAGGDLDKARELAARARALAATVGTQDMPAVGQLEADLRIAEGAASPG